MSDLTPPAPPAPLTEPTSEPVSEPDSAPVSTSAPDPAPVPVPPAPVPAPEQPSAAPEQPPAPPAWGPPDLLVSGARRPDRRRVRAALRWTAAVLVFAVFGAGTAYAVTRPERTDIPGLKTPDDGRWTYPPIALPPLPAGRAYDRSDLSRVHYPDLRSLLVPLPRDAVEDRSFPGTKGWLPTAKYMRLRPGGGGDQLLASLKENGLRHIAARAWTMPDGTRTEVYLVQFVTAGYASEHFTDADGRGLDSVTTDARDKSIVPGATPLPKDLHVSAYAETPPYGPTMTRYALINAGDTVGLVAQTRKQAVPEVPFRQTTVLQAQLLDEQPPGQG